MKTKKILIPDDGLILEPNKIYLGYTVETIGSDKYVPLVHGRSSTGRIGLFVHITSDLVDIGFKGNITLQLHATQKVKIYKGMKIGQVSFWNIDGDIKLYEGKYQNSIGPQKTQIYKSQFPEHLSIELVGAVTDRPPLRHNTFSTGDQ